MWYQQGYDILLHYWSGPHEFVSFFMTKSKKNQEENNNQWLTFYRWDLMPNQHQRMHGNKRRLIRLVKDMKESALQVSKNAQDNSLVSQSWSRQKLVHLVNIIRNV